MDSDEDRDVRDNNTRPREGDDWGNVAYDANYYGEERYGEASYHEGNNAEVLSPHYLTILSSHTVIYLHTEI